jgi:hypothetical protein
MKTRRIKILLLCCCLALAGRIWASEKVLMTRLKCEDPDADDSLMLEISEPDIARDANGVVYTWHIRCCDNHEACDDAWLMTDNYIKGDVNNDKKVDFKDLAIVADNWLESVN